MDTPIKIYISDLRKIILVLFMSILNNDVNLLDVSETIENINKA